MIDEEVFDVLKSINADISEDQEMDLLGSGMIDSFDIVNIVAELEKKFQIEIDAEDIVPENFSRLADIIGLVKKYK